MRAPFLLTITPPTSLLTLMAPSLSSHSQHSPSERPPSAQDHLTDAVGSGNGARYRLMSPAKLPISSRSTCISIPPGLSPTSFLDSPVLLANIKAEPSQTTSSFFKHQWMCGSGENAAHSIDENISSGNTVDERMASRFQTGASSASGLLSAGLSNGNGPVGHQDQPYLQSSSPSNFASQAVAVGLQDVSAVGTTADELNRGHSNAGVLESSSEHKDSISSVSGERTSNDGYNWRKYGQKVVKGSEFPRSYYKCSYPNCEVKKIFERSTSGQITEIVYKGSHYHPKPHTSRRHNPGPLSPIHEDKLDKDLSIIGSEGKLNAKNMEQNGSPMFSPLQQNEEGNDDSDSQFQSINDNVETDDHFLKRRKMEDSFDAIPIVKPIREPRVVVQTVSEVDILDDGYRWRKYGQKVVRGNPNPRSYYKCTNAGCPVRKHVERASHNPKAVLTTYESKHKHDLPTVKNSCHEYAGIPKLMPLQDSGGSISLHLGVGIGREIEKRTNGHLQALDGEAAGNLNRRDDLSTMGVQGSRISVCYGIVNSGLNLHGNGQNGMEDHRIHPSKQCRQNLGSIIMGP